MRRLVFKKHKVKLQVFLLLLIKKPSNQIFMYVQSFTNSLEQNSVTTHTTYLTTRVTIPCNSRLWSEDCISRCVFARGAVCVSIPVTYSVEVWAINFRRQTLRHTKLKDFFITFHIGMNHKTLVTSYACFFATRQN